MMEVLYFDLWFGSWNMIGIWNTGLDACMLDLDMYRGTIIQDGFYPGNQNPG